MSKVTRLDKIRNLEAILQDLGNVHELLDGEQVGHLTHFYMSLDNGLTHNGCNPYSLMKAHFGGIGLTAVTTPPHEREKLIGFLQDELKHITDWIDGLDQPEK